MQNFDNLIKDFIIAQNNLKTLKNEVETAEEELQKKEALLIEVLETHNLKTLDHKLAKITLKRDLKANMPTVISMLRENDGNKPIQEEKITRCVEALKKHNGEHIIKTNLLIEFPIRKIDKYRSFIKKLMDMSNNENLDCNLRYDCQTQTLKKHLRELFDNDVISQEDRVELINIFNIEFFSKITCKEK